MAQVIFSERTADDANDRLKQIKAAIFDQAFTGKARVMCPMGPVVAVRRRKGQILAMIRGWGKWYPVESVQISLIGVGRQCLS